MSLAQFVSSPSFAFSSPNPSASSSHAPRNLEEPLVFNKDYKYLTNWYDYHRSNGSTTIKKMQLRKEHVTPFHEFIMVETQAGYMYRVDRGRAAGGTVLDVLDTLKKQGVPPVDTIALLSDLTSLGHLDGTSYCRIELSWRSDKTIDLKLVLDVCFQIHNKSGTRYKLLTLNCYFFAQTIIMIAARKTVACELKDRCQYNERLWDHVTKTIQVTETILKWWQTHLKQEVLSQLKMQPLEKMWKIGWWQDLLNRELELRYQDLDLELRREKLMGELMEQLVRELDWKLVRELVWELLHPRREPEWEGEQDQKQWQQKQEQEQERQEQWQQKQQEQWQREQEWEWKRIVKRLLGMEQVKWRAWGQKWIVRLVLMLVPMLVSKRKKLELRQDLALLREWEDEWRQEWMQGRERERQEQEQERWKQQMWTQEQVRLWTWKEVRQVWKQALEQVCEGRGGIWENGRGRLRWDLQCKLRDYFGRLELEQPHYLEQIEELLGMQRGQLGMQLGNVLWGRLRNELWEHLAETLEPQIVFRLQLPVHQQQTYQQLQDQLQDQCKMECQTEVVLFQKVLLEVLDRGLNRELELSSWDINCAKIMEATNMPDESGTWARPLIETLGKIVIREAQMEQLLGGCSFSHLLKFPASFSASSKANAKAPRVTIKKFKDLEICIKQLVEQHLDSVPLSMISRDKLGDEIMHGMTTTWHLV